MTPQRRTTKEPELPDDSPFAPFVRVLASQVAGYRASVRTTDPDDIQEREFLDVKIEALEGAIHLAKRLGRGENIDAPAGPRPLVEVADGPIARPPETDTVLAAPEAMTLEERMDRLEATVANALQPKPVLFRGKTLKSWIEPVEEPKRAPKPPPPERDKTAIGRCEQALLGVLRRYRGPLAAFEVALRAQYSPTSSSTDRAFRRLRDLGAIQDTPAVCDLVRDGPDLPWIEPVERDRLLDAWLAMLPACEGRILVALDHSPGGLGFDALADATEYSSSSSSFNAAIRELRAKGLAQPDKGWPLRLGPAFGPRELR
jgi:hypothetical protein